MAFPVPDHLPRKQIPADVSSQILTKISDATSKSLTAGLAAQWVSELELNIQQTRDRIYERIHEKLPEFERQLEISRSVQTRLRDLSSNVDRVAETLEDPEASLSFALSLAQTDGKILKEGLLPTLVNSLKAHKELTQRALDAQVTYEALTYLDRCRVQIDTLNDVVNDGRLTEGIGHGNKLAELLGGAPEALARADVMVDMKNQLRAARDRIEEQLNEAYSRSVRISSTELRLSPSIQVRQSQTIISLRDILACLSSTSLDSLLTTLRRDIVAYFIDVPLQQACSSNAERISGEDGAPSTVFSIFPLPPSSAYRNSTPSHLKSLFDFLRENLFTVLPPSATSSFPQSLYKPTTTALLRDVIVPSLPSSLIGLPTFLDLVRIASEFEEEYILKPMPGTQSKLRGEGEIRAWARDVSGHYGRKLRIDLLAEARKLILSVTDGPTVRVELSETSEVKPASHVPDVIPVQGEIGAGEEGGWDFDDGEPTSHSAKAEANGKALDDESKARPEQTEENESGAWDFDDADVGESDRSKVEEDVQDDSDAWGWGDDEENSTPATSENGNTGSSAQQTNGHEAIANVAQENSEEVAWDSAWDDPDPAPPPPPSQSPLPAKAPKVAKGLEKRTAKGKQKGAASPALPSNLAASTLSSSNSSTLQPLTVARASSPTSLSSPAPTHLNAPQIAQSGLSRPPALSLSQKPKTPETYLISAHVQDLVHLIAEILSEGRTTAASSIFSDFPLSDPESTNKAGTLIFQVAPAVIDLYRAIYPVVSATQLSHPARALRFANDCTYMHEEVAKIEVLSPDAAAASPSVHEQMRETLERLHALGAWWFDEGVERECKRVLRILSRAEGFIDTSDQDRFDGCEAVMSEVLREIRTATGEWKTILPRSKWLQAAGRLVETALTRVLDDVLAIPDIPELDSQRLSELCRILNALEGLFVDIENPEAPSMVLDYVPSWLKYSYLSELLGATIADISYLFDEGALIDFTIDELVRLVRALFADTPLRSNTIAKLQRGHPVPTE